MSLFLLSIGDGPLVLLFVPWIVGPAGLSAMMAGSSPAREWTSAAFTLEALIVGSTIWYWYHLNVLAPDAQNPIAMMVFPVLQYAAVALFFLVALLVDWRARRAAGSNEPTR